LARVYKKTIRAPIKRFLALFGVLLALIPAIDVCQRLINLSSVYWRLLAFIGGFLAFSCVSHKAPNVAQSAQ